MRTHEKISRRKYCTWDIFYICISNVRTHRFFLQLYLMLQLFFIVCIQHEPDYNFGSTALLIIFTNFKSRILSEKKYLFYTQNTTISGFKSSEIKVFIFILFFSNKFFSMTCFLNCWNHFKIYSWSVLLLSLLINPK